MGIKIFKVKGSDGETIQGEGFVDDILTAELFQPAGFHHIPEKDLEGVCVFIGADESHGILIAPKKANAQTNDPGETVIYSLSGGEVKARIVLDGAGNIELNGNDKRLVTFTDLDVALQTFLTNLNAALFTGFAAVPYVWPGVSLDISASETQTVKTGG